MPWRCNEVFCPPWTESCSRDELQARRRHRDRPCLQAYLLWVRGSSARSWGFQLYGDRPIVLNVDLHVRTELAI